MGDSGGQHRVWWGLQRSRDLVPTGPGDKDYKQTYFNISILLSKLFLIFPRLICDSHFHIPMELPMELPRATMPGNTQAW